MNEFNVASIGEDYEISADGESATCTLHGKDTSQLQLRLDRSAMANVATLTARLDRLAEETRRKQGGLYERQAVSVVRVHAHAEMGTQALVVTMQTPRLPEHFHLRLDQAEALLHALRAAIDEAKTRPTNPLS